MLASLLPGVRDLRAPLGCGCLWLVALWLAVGPVSGQSRITSAAPFRDVAALATAWPLLALAAATFTAYLLGILSIQLTTGGQNLLRRLRGSPERSAHRPSAIGRQALRDAVLTQLSERVDRDDDLAEQLSSAAEYCGESRPIGDPDGRRAMLAVRLDLPRYERRLAADLPLLPLRLLGNDSERQIYAEYDRLRAEAEFRTAVAAPLAAIAIVVAVRYQPWLIVAAAAPMLLLYDAWRRTRTAADVLAEYLRGRIGEEIPLTPAVGWIRTGRISLRADWKRYAMEKDYPAAVRRYADALRADGDPAAETYYRRAATAGDADATFVLAGLLYLRGDASAQTWYARATDAGCTDAAELADLTPRLSPDDLATVRRAYAGDQDAMLAAGTALDITGEAEHAERWLRAALEAGVEAARPVLAALLRAQGDDLRARALERASR